MQSHPLGRSCLLYISYITKKKITLAHRTRQKCRHDENRFQCTDLQTEVTNSSLFFTKIWLITGKMLLESMRNIIYAGMHPFQLMFLKLLLPLFISSCK